MPKTLKKKVHFHTHKQQQQKFMRFCLSSKVSLMWISFECCSLFPTLHLCVVNFSLVSPYLFLFFLKSRARKVTASNEFAYRCYCSCYFSLCIECLKICGQSMPNQIKSTQLPSCISLFFRFDTSWVLTWNVLNCSYYHRLLHHISLSIFLDALTSYAIRQFSSIQLAINEKI